MAPIAIDLIERRRKCRCAGGGARWRCHADLLPRQSVTSLNLAAAQHLVESAARLRPARTPRCSWPLQCATSIAGRLDRATLPRSEPIRYRGVLLFDERVDVGEEHH